MTSTEPGSRLERGSVLLSSRGATVLLITATMLGLGLRINDLGRLGLEIDEGLYSYIADLPIRVLPAYLGKHESTPPLYLVLLKAWQSLFDSDIGIRLLSVAMGTVAIPVMYFAGRRILGRAGGAAAAFFLAVAPYHVYLSRIAKNPSLFFLLTLSALLSLLAVAQGRGRRLVWVGFSLALAGMLYTHGLAPFFVLGLGVVFFVGAKIPWTANLRPCLVAHLAAGVLFLPWFGVALHQARETLDNFWAPRPSITQPLVTAAKFTLVRPDPPLIQAADLPLAGSWLSSHQQAGVAADRFLAWIWFLPAGVTCALSVWLLVAARRWRILCVLASLFVVPVGSIWLVSQLTASVYIDRALLPALIPIPLLLAVPFGFLPAAPESAGGPFADNPSSPHSPLSDGAGGASADRPRPPWPRLLRWALGASVASFLVLLLSVWQVIVARHGEQLREAAALIGERGREGEALVFDAHFGQILFERYLGPKADRFTMYGLPAGVRDSEIPDWSLRVESDEDLAPLVTAASRHPALWLVLSHTEVHDRRGLAARWCNENLRQTEIHRFVGVVLARYETRRD